MEMKTLSLPADRGPYYLDVSCLAGYVKTELQYATGTVWKGPDYTELDAEQRAFDQRLAGVEAVSTEVFNSNLEILRTLK